MKLKFKIKQKDNSISHEAIFNSMLEGDSWVAQNALAFGRPDLSLKENDLAKYGFTPEQAASTETDIDGLPLYHFPKEWSVEIVDITLEDTQKNKVQDRASVRAKCLALVDEIASINKDSGATDVTMDTIFMTPSFQGICLALLTGAPGTAKRLMITNGPSLYPQATVDLFVSKLAELE